MALQDNSLDLLLQDADDSAWLLHMQGTQGDSFAPPPAGMALAVISEYVDLGKHPDRHGKVKDKSMITLTLFETNPAKPKGYSETLQDEEGNTYTRGSLLRVNLPTRSANPRSRYAKLVRRIAEAVGVEPKDDVIRIIDLLGKPFAVRVYHNEVTVGEEKKIYANIEKDGGEMQIVQPYALDEDGEPNLDKPLKVPADAQITYRLFMWESASLTHWNSLFIEGTRERKDEKGETKEVSKNWMQEEIRKASNFIGSPIEGLLIASGSSSAKTPKSEKVKVEKDTAADEDTVKETKKKEVLVAEIGAIQSSITLLKESGMDASTLEEQLEKMKAELSELEG